MKLPGPPTRRARPQQASRTIASCSTALTLEYRLASRVAPANSAFWGSSISAGTQVPVVARHAPTYTACVLRKRVPPLCTDYLRLEYSPGSTSFRMPPPSNWMLRGKRPRTTSSPGISVAMSESESTRPAFAEASCPGNQSEDNDLCLQFRDPLAKHPTEAA